MSKIPLIFSGLGVGTAVTGGTHFVKNIQPVLGQTTIRSNGSVFGTVNHPKPDVSSEKSDGPKTLTSPEAKDGSSTTNAQNNRGQVNDETQLPLADASQVIAKPEPPKEGLNLPKSSSDARSGRVNDIFAPSVPKLSRQRKGGTEDHPDVICVAEETEDKTYDYQGRSSNRFRAVCVKTNNDRDYYKAKSAPVCSFDINGNLGSEFFETLLNPQSKLCRYWDSFKQSNDQKLSFSDIHIPASY
ncbi:hypothetical protein MHLP_01770 [Candidatus Mycoplasma haematolamae str. Purdue]|uniref:Uncharacterized protein n=1 Tax=Mycoplasma haematolamae (strain Purdue) TaxID=1212765 RepID=I7CJB4_MYCHA|nr:hypothetical protein [Candidatus Mycoplasma haematolamae]AFO51934.1 hypothetical protein MHLP_01770 [Candidatus Mycoplasma haematolamae str. Purdue]